MSIDKDAIGYGYDLMCDNCEDIVHQDNFEDAIQHKKDEGWKSVKDADGEWWDLCPGCQSPDVIRRFKGES